MCLNPPNYCGDNIRWLEVQKRLPNGKGKLLDLGAGNGQFKELVESKGYVYVGVDLVPNEEKEIVKGDATNLEMFDDKSFSAVLCIDTLEHIKNDKGAVKEMFRVLKDDGMVIIHVPNKAQVHVLTEPQEQHDHVRKGYTLSEAKELFREFSDFRAFPTFLLRSALLWDINYCFRMGIPFDLDTLVNLEIDDFTHYGWLFKIIK